VLSGHRILVVVPARGGSRGVPRKNLRAVAGVPLVARVGLLVAELDFVDRAVVSTDDEEIAAVAEASGLAAPFRRPAALSGDRVGDLDVLTHALETCERMDGDRYDVVVMLQPTSPLRRPEHVSAVVEKLVRGGWDAVWTLSPTDLKYHPRKQLRLDGDRLDFFDPAGATVIARQQLEPVYHRNGAAYAISRECLLSQKSILGKNASAVIVREPMWSIDSEQDFEAVETALRAREDGTP
jgi:CMP-N-acetylneuraminic acid synthetase